MLWNQVDIPKEHLMGGGGGGIMPMWASGRGSTV